MRFTKSSIVVAVMALSLPALAQVVLPPTPPGAATVIPPSGLASVNSAPVPLSQTGAPAMLPTAAVPAQAPAEEVKPLSVLDLALPQGAPVQQTELRPSAPQGSLAALGVPPKSEKGKREEGKKPRAEKPAKEKSVEIPLDPYAAIVGTPVSDSQLNRFVFPEPVLRVFFPEGAPLPTCPENASEFDPCQPVFLNEQRMMLLQLRAGAKGPVQMLTHMKSGEMLTLNLMPAPGPGAVIRVAGAEDGASDERIAEGKTLAGVGIGATGAHESERHVEILSRIASGDIPAGFAPVGIQSGPTKFEYFEAQQMASWDNGAGMRAHLFEISGYGETPVVVTPDMFRHDAVLSLALNRGEVTKAAPALLYILEAGGK